MRQIGTVTYTNGQEATVTVRRMSACEGCHKTNPGTMTDGEYTYSACHECSMFPLEEEMTVLASDDLGARVGDRVVIESSTKTILSYAAAVFLLPLLLAFAGGIAAAFVTDANWAPYLGAVLGFVGAFLFVRAVVDRYANEKTVHKIVRIMTPNGGNATQNATNKIKTETMDH